MSGERGEPTHSTSGQVIFLRGVSEGGRGLWLVVRLVQRWGGAVTGLISFTDGDGSQQLWLHKQGCTFTRASPCVSVCSHMYFCHPIHSLAPIPMTTKYKRVILFRWNCEYSLCGFTAKHLYVPSSDGNTFNKWLAVILSDSAHKLSYVRWQRSIIEPSETSSELSQQCFISKRGH